MNSSLFRGLARLASRLAVAIGIAACVMPAFAQQAALDKSGDRLRRSPRQFQPPPMIRLHRRSHQHTSWPPAT